MKCTDKLTIYDGFLLLFFILNLACIFSAVYLMINVAVVVFHRFMLHINPGSLERVMKTYFVEQISHRTQRDPGMKNPPSFVLKWESF